MLQIIEFMLFVFISILLYFTLTLFYISYSEKRKKKHVEDIKKHVDDSIEAYTSSNVNKLDNRLIRSKLGLYTVINYSSKLDDEKRKIFKKLILESNYFNYIVKSLKTNDKNQLIFNIKLIGELEISKFKGYVYDSLDKYKEDIYLQYNILLALAKLKDNVKIQEILLNRKIDITERALKNVFDVLECDKFKLYKRLVKEGNKFIKKSALYQIGFDKVYELENEVIKYLSSENIDLKIAAISAAGNLKSQRSLNIIKKLIDSKETDVKKECIIAMNLINDAECSEEFITLLGDKDWQIKYIAAMALCDVKDIDNILTKVKNLNDKLSLDILKYAIERRKLIKGVENDERILIMCSTIR